MKISGFTFKVMFLLGIVLIIIGLIGTYVFLSSILSDYNNYRAQLEQSLSKFKSDSPEISIINKKITESLIESGILVIIFLLALIGIISFFGVDGRYKKYLKEIKGKSEIRDVFIKYSLDAKSEFCKIDNYLKSLLNAHKKDETFIIREIPSAYMVIEPIKVESEQNVIYLKWISLTSVLIGLIGTMLSLVWAISGAIESLNTSSGNIIEGFRNSLEPLKYAFYCSVAGVFSGFMLNLFRILADSRLESFFAELEKRLTEYIPVMYKNKNFDLPENKMIKIADGMTQISKELKEVTESIKSETNAIVTALHKDIVKTFKERMEEISKNITALFDEKFTSVISKFDKDINDNLIKVINNTNKEYKDLLESSKGLISQKYDDLRSSLSSFTTAMNQNNKLIEELKKLNNDLLQNVKENKGTLDDMSSKIENEIGKTIAGYLNEIKTSITNDEKIIMTINSEIGKIVNAINTTGQFYKLSEDTNKNVKVFNEEFDHFYQQVKTFNTEVVNAMNIIKNTLTGFQGLNGTISDINEVNKQLKTFMQNISSIEEILKNQQLGELFAQQKEYLNNLKDFNSVILNTLNLINNDIKSFSNGKENG